MKRKTTKKLAELFEITWGSDGTGEVKYEITGKPKFSESFSSSSINNLADLELGDYTVTCTITSPNGIQKSATKEKVNITNLADTTLTDLEGNNLTGNAIYSEYDLAYFRDLVNERTKEEPINGKLMNHINLKNVCGQTKENWIPMGNEAKPYNGVFQGDKPYIIDNLYIDTEEDFQGLFGSIKNAQIFNLVIGENSNIKGGLRVGGITGDGENSKIENCGNHGTIQGAGRVAGIAGRVFEFEITKCYNQGSTNGGNTGYQCGGIVGIINKSAIESYITSSYNWGKVEGGYAIAGIVGMGGAYTNIKNCYNTGEVIANTIQTNGATSLGGIVGELIAYGNIQYCYNLGTITNNTTGDHTGGIAGTNSAWEAGDPSYWKEERASKIQNSYNSGTIESKGKYIGGICGKNIIYCQVKDSYSKNGTTIQCNGTNASSDIGLANNYLGRVVGKNEATSQNVSNVGILSTMPTVYKVVNGLSEGKSEIWQNNNVDKPQLLWESKLAQ